MIYLQLQLHVQGQGLQSLIQFQVGTALDSHCQTFVTGQSTSYIYIVLGRGPEWSGNAWY